MTKLIKNNIITLFSDIEEVKDDVTNIQNGGTGVYRNAIINGDMQIAQRGTSFASIATSEYSLDRWQYIKAGTTVQDITQDTDVPSTDVFKYSSKLDVTTADSSIDAGHFVLFQQAIEGYNFAPYVDKTATLSFWVKSTKTGTFCVAFLNSASDGCYVAEYTITDADTWEYKKITITIDTSIGTWDYTSGVGLRVRWVLACGSTYQTTADTWQSGNYFSTSNQVNACDSTDNNFYLTGVQLNIGDEALPFEHLSYEENLRRCQRYYEKTVDTAGSQAMRWACDITTGVQYVWNHQWRVSKRIAGTGTMIDYTKSTQFDAPTVYYCGINSISCSAIANATSSGRAISFQVSGDAEL